MWLETFGHLFMQVVFIVQLSQPAFPNETQEFSQPISIFFTEIGSALCVHLCCHFCTCNSRNMPCRRRHTARQSTSRCSVHMRSAGCCLFRGVKRTSSPALHLCTFPVSMWFFFGMRVQGKGIRCFVRQKRKETTESVHKHLTTQQIVQQSAMLCRPCLIYEECKTWRDSFSELE